MLAFFSNSNNEGLFGLRLTLLYCSNQRLIRTTQVLPQSANLVSAAALITLPSPTGGAAILDESDPAIMATNGTVTPVLTAFVGTQGPGCNSIAGATGYSAAATSTADGAASAGRGAMNLLIGCVMLAGGILVVVMAL